MPNSSTAPSGTKGSALRAMARSTSPGGRVAGVAGGRELSTTQVEVAFGEQALGVRPRHLVVHLGDDRAADVERRHQVIGGEPEAVFAARIRRTHLEHDHVAPELRQSRINGPSCE